MSDEQLGVFLRAVFAYEKRGEAYSGQDIAVKMAMGFVCRTLDRNREKYKATCERNRRNIEKRWGNPKDTGGNFGTEQYTTDTSGISGIPIDTKHTEHEPEPDPDPDPEREQEQEPEQDACGGGSGLFPFPFARSDLNLILEQLTDAGIPANEEGKRKLVEWLQRYGFGFVEEVVWVAIRQKARKFGYLEGIVRNWVSAGITTGEKAVAYQIKTGSLPGYGGD